MYVELVTDFLVDPQIQIAGSEARDLYVQFLLIAKQWGTDGKVSRGHLRFASHDNPMPAAARLVELGLLIEVVDGWVIVAWLKYNASMDQIRAGNRRGGLRSGEVRRAALDSRVVAQSNMPNEVQRSDLNALQVTSSDIGVGQTCPTKSNEVERSPLKSVEVPRSPGAGAGGSAVTAVLPNLRTRVGLDGSVIVQTAVPGNGSAAAAASDVLPPAPEDDDGPAWEANDPAYRLVPEYAGAEHLAQWQSKIGPIPARYHLECLNTFVRLHTHCHRSLRELTALVDHVATNADARKFWGAGKTPGRWLTSRDGGEPTWRRVLASWLDGRKEFPLGRSEAAAVQLRIPPGHAPAADPACDCRNGWIMPNGNREGCPKCARGKHIRAGGRL